MTTAVRIASNALLRLGAAPINSFDEADSFGSNIDFARLASNLWPSVRQQVLRSHLWNSAVKRVLLSPDATKPAFGYANRFQLPGDWLRTLAVGEGGHEGIEFKTECGYILANSGALQLSYLYDNQNPATWDVTLIGAMEVAMAAAMAYPVTKSTSLAQALSAELQDQLRSARALDAQDDSPQTFGDFPLLNSRFGNRLHGFRG